MEIKNPNIIIGDDVIEDIIAVKLRNADDNGDEFVEFPSVIVQLNTEV